MPWNLVARLEDCPAPGESGEFVVADRIVALFNCDGEFFALDGICPHQGGPLGQSQLAGCIVTCKWHGWQFDVRTGQHQASPRLRQPSFPVKVEEGEVFVDLPG